MNKQKNIYKKDAWFSENFPSAKVEMWGIFKQAGTDW